MYRRALSFIAVIGAAFLWACDSSSDLKPGLTLEGTWAATEFRAQITSTTTINSEELVLLAVMEGANFDYNLTFTDTEFSTSGSYTINTQGVIDGQGFSSTPTDFNNVSGSGPYTATASQISVQDSFFTLELDGEEFETEGIPQTVEYTLNGDRLELFQSETFTFTEQGITVSVRMLQSSRWTRQ